MNTAFDSIKHVNFGSYNFEIVSASFYQPFDVHLSFLMKCKEAGGYILSNGLQGIPQY